MGSTGRPMRSLPGSRTCTRLRALAATYGFQLEDMQTGGCSDGNFTASYEPTLDGLGVDGQGSSHSERLVISTIPQRALLLERLMQALSRLSILSGYIRHCHPQTHDRADGAGDGKLEHRYLHACESQRPWSARLVRNSDGHR
ncbi:hypothetical protein CHELA1G11_20976 [Hyphomicrobiales bacterium]|nr:hypothetical protein CHELA1G11_20976 [Hyphomicrobiales bacterium]CAH1692822.1 hypothetical protein CHELA1G2_21292 [Hyphomicrobiales bacterium]